MGAAQGQNQTELVLERVRKAEEHAQIVRRTVLGQEEQPHRTHHLRYSHQKGQKIDEGTGLAGSRQQRRCHEGSSPLQQEELHPRKHSQEEAQVQKRF